MEDETLKGSESGTSQRVESETTDSSKGETAGGGVADENVSDSSRPATNDAVQKKTLGLSKVSQKFKKLGKKSKIAICAAVLVVAAVVIYSVVFSSPFVGKWYTADSENPVIEIKSNGTAVVTKNPEASVNWKKLENGDIKVSMIDLSKGDTKTTSFTFSYGKTNNGIEYIDGGGTLFFKSYNDAQKVKEASESKSGDAKDMVGSSSSSSKSSYGSSGSKKSSSSSK